MLPGVMIDFLARASVAVASTRDAHLVPHIHFLSGWSVEEDRETVLCLVAAGFVPNLMGPLEDNGQLAMTAEKIGPHETYQFKGRYVGSRPPCAADVALVEACRERFVVDVQRAYGDRFTREMLRRKYGEPALAVRFRVHEVYVQTPGPAAGRRLLPRED